MPDLLARYAAGPAWARHGLLALGGGLSALGQSPTDAWYLTLAAMAALLAIYAQAVTARAAALTAWVFGIGYFAVSLRWIIEPFLVDVARHGWMAPFAIVLMAAGAGLFWGLAGWLAFRIASARVAAFAIALVGAEILRSLIFTGFPWALIGHIWIATPLAQLAAFGGPHLLSAITVLGAWALWQLSGPGRMVGAGVVVVLALLGFVTRPGPGLPPDPSAPVVRLVQPNAPQDQKWHPAFRDEFVRRMVRLTAEGTAPDLVVWPETSVPYLYRSLDDHLQVFSDAARGAPLVFGVQRRDDARRAFNSLVVLGPGAKVESIYDKRHLVPFGEYMPGAALLGRAGMTGLARNLGIGFTPGDVAGPLHIPGIGGAIPLICYEGIFAEEISYSDERPRLMLLITNDAWFGQAAGPQQHLAQARLRAIEQGLPMVRVANTGVSAMIDARGRITASLPLGVDGAIDAALPPVLPETPYARWGDLPIILLLVVLLFATAVAARRNSD